MKRLIIKTEGFLPGNKIFFRGDGTFSILDSETLPEEFIFGVEAEESGVVSTSLGTYYINVTEGSEVVVSRLFAVEDKESYSVDYEEEVSSLGELFPLVTEFGGNTGMSYTQDGGFAFASFERAVGSTDLYLYKTGTDGTFTRIIDTSTLSPSPYPEPVLNNSAGSVLGLLTSSSGWYIYITDSSTTRCYLAYLDFETPSNDMFSYIGQGNTSNILPVELEDLYNQLSVEDIFGAKIRASLDGNIYVLWGSWGPTVIKFDSSDLSYLYHYDDVGGNRLQYAERVDPTDGPTEVYPIQYSLSVRGNEVYIPFHSYSLYQNDAKYYYETGMFRLTDTGAEFTLGEVSVFEDVEKTELYGWKEQYASCIVGDMLFTTGVAWDNPVTQSYDTHGIMTSAISLADKELVWRNITYDLDIGAAEYGVQGYEISSMQDRVYAAGYVEALDGVSPEFTIFMYDSASGNLLGRLLPSTYYQSSITNTDTLVGL